MAAVTVATTLVVIPVGLVTTVVDLAVASRRVKTEDSPRQPMVGRRKTGTKKTDYPHGGETKTKHCQKLN